MHREPALTISQLAEATVDTFETALVESPDLLRALGEWAVAMERNEAESRIEELAITAASTLNRVTTSLTQAPAA